MRTLKSILKVGTVLGDGARSYTVAKAVTENITLRRHPGGVRNQTTDEKSVIRIIPTVIVEDILSGIRSNVISLEDVIRKNRAEKQLPDIFTTLGLEHDLFLLGYDATIQKICEFVLNAESDEDTRPETGNLTAKIFSLPKPFLLLAGISGTGKTRVVREQAARHREDLSNYCLIPVRPDWHEPSDLLGYVSRVGKPQYVVTDLLRFVVAAWKNAYATASADTLVHKNVAQMTPYWLCLDEMNLAPVEQYFADYLAVLETRQWHDGHYTCDALLKAAAFNTLGDLDGGLGKMRADLALAGAEFDGLWAYFLRFGIALPPNLMVAGTVNMDETTHGFSRKVIDRAFTVDFGAFYPNDFVAYFTSTLKAKALGFPCVSAVDLDDLAAVAADVDGQKSIQFLSAVNAVLAQTPFELAFRALNELLIALVCFAPKDDAHLQAVWDDFLMTKVLPRIDGDGHKLAQSNTESLLTRLSVVAQQQCTAIWDGSRLDLLRENLDGSRCEVLCRSKAKLAWMQARLEANGFTSFWP
jgi:hypothetical protein